MVKKCPVCNSTRYKKVDDDFRCARCGFINKSADSLNKQIKKHKEN